MLKIILSFAFLLAAACGSGELTILHHPGSILLKGHDRLDESSLKEVYSAALGFSIDHISSWPGMYLTSPFDLAEAVVSFSIDGVADLGIGKGHGFPLRTNADDDETFYALQTRIENRNPGGDSKIVDINLSEGLDAISDYEFLHGIKHIKKSKASHSFLKATVEEDRAFLMELNLLNAIIAEIEKGVVKADAEPDYFNIRCISLHALFDLYGENSTEAKEARQLLIEAIYRLNNAFTKAYDGSVLFTVVSSDTSHTRRIRSAGQGEAKASRATTKPDINLAKTYNPNYPVIFNMILWFGVVMVFTLLAISITIGTMDPGRDSIIYRMTSTRMKKDN